MRVNVWKWSAGLRTLNTLGDLDPLLNSYVATCLDNGGATARTNTYNKYSKLTDKFGLQLADWKVPTSLQSN